MTPAPQISRVASATATACRPIEAAEAIRAIRDGDHAEAIDAIRQAVAEGKPTAALKRRLPGLLWTGTFSRRAIAGFTLSSCLLVADLDALPNPGQVRDDFAFDPHVYAAFLSPSGTGVKVVFRHDRGGDHAAAWGDMEAYLASKYNLTPDPSGKDVCRLCFVSHDPQAHHQPDATPLPHYTPPPPAPVVKPSLPTPPTVKQSLAVADLSPGDDFDRRGLHLVPDLLRSAGWTQVGNSEKWRRPGVKDHHGATLGVAGPGVLHVFTSGNDLLPPGNYGPFRLLAALSFGGDHSTAAKELARQGYGARRPRTAGATPEPVGVEGTAPANPGQPAPESPEDRIRRLLRERAFDCAHPPPELRPVFRLGGAVICTPGNLTAITAQAKVGKSAFVAAMCAAAMALTDEPDTLGVIGRNASGKALLYFDTEQSPHDFWHGIDRARRRACLDAHPAWVRAWMIADLTVADARQALRVALEDASLDCEGIHAVIIDGVADLVADVNDAEECNGLVAELHRLAIRHDCPIICVIHKNPSSDKVRGHLGSQLERKAETNLSMEKDDEITLVWSNKQRGAPILKKDAVRFRWDDALRMHATLHPGDAPLSGRAGGDSLRELAEAILRPGDQLQWGPLRDALMSTQKCARVTAERRIKAMLRAGVIKISYGYYSLT